MAAKIQVSCKVCGGDFRIAATDQDVFDGLCPICAREVAKSAPSRPAPAARTWTCPQCAKTFRLADGQVAPDLCPSCAKTFTLTRRKSAEETHPEHAAAEARRAEDEEREEFDQSILDAVVLTTTAALPGMEIEEVLEVVTAECVNGVSAWNDLFASFSDFFGGRSGKMQRVLRQLRAICLDELKKEAVLAGGNAVIGVALAYSEIGVGRQMSMLMLVASGTAVKVRVDRAKEEK